MIYLRQSTASQVVPLGRFVDSTDGNTEETGLTIANTDIKVWKAGATSLANKNSGGATHMAGGEYYCTLDATDTNTVGPLKLTVHVSGALYVQVFCCVLEEAVYDALFAASAAGYQIPIWAATSSTVNLSATTIKTATDVETDTQDIQSRLPAALGANGNIKADVRDFNGVGGTFASGRPEINMTHIAGTAWASTTLFTLASHDPGATIGTSTLTQTQVTGGAYSIQNASCVLGDARIANLDGTVTSRAAAATALSTATWTSARAGYIDNLNVGGNVASSAEVTAIQNNTRIVCIVPDQIELPDSSTTTYLIHLYLYDTTGNMEAPDSAPTVTLANSAGTDRSSRLGSTTGTLVATGHYKWTYTASTADTLEQLLWEFTVVEGGATRIIGRQSLIVEQTAYVFNSTYQGYLTSIYNKLPSSNYLSGTAQSDGRMASNGLANVTAWTVNLTGSMSGAVGSVTGNVGGNVTGSIGSLAAQAKADVNAEADTALADVGVTSTVTGRIDTTLSGRAPDATQVRTSMPPVMEIPIADSITTRIEIIVCDGSGTPSAPTTAPTVALVDQDGNSLTGRLSATTMTAVSTGRYRVIYTSTAGDAAARLQFLFTVVRGGVTQTIPAMMTTIDFSSLEKIDTAMQLDAFDNWQFTTTALALGAGSAPTAVQNADALLGRNVAGGSNGGRTVADSLARLRNRNAISGATFTVYATDDTTPLWTAAITTEESLEPVSDMDPT